MVAGDILLLLNAEELNCPITYLITGSVITLSLLRYQIISIACVLRFSWNKSSEICLFNTLGWSKSSFEVGLFFSVTSYAKS